MLDPLPTTDLLSKTPDVDGLDLWSDDFEWDMVPGEYGCYAFFDQIGRVLYIGSAGASSPDKSQRGLRMRLRFYRGRGKAERITSTIAKVRQAAKNQRLILRCWIAASAGDARKYEDDAIRQHRPPLNWIGSREVSLDAWRARKRQWALNYAETKAAYDPDMIKLCPNCGQHKKCSEFTRHKYRRFGVASWCKLCRSKSRGTRASKVDDMPGL